jgi:hypothetical protein
MEGPQLTNEESAALDAAIADRELRYPMINFSNGLVLLDIGETFTEDHPQQVAELAGQILGGRGVSSKRRRY